MSDAPLNAPPSDLANSLGGAAPERIAEALRGFLAEQLREEVRRAVRLSMREDEFLRRLGAEARRAASGEGEAADAGLESSAQTGLAKIGEILDDASAKLDQILQTTERSAIEIIELVERRLSAHGEVVELARSCPDPELRGRMLAMLESQNADLMRIMTCLSFQDLMGQRVKRVMDSLAKARAAAPELGARADASGEKPAPPPAPEPPAPSGAASSGGASPSVSSQDEVDALLGRLGM